MAGGTTVRTTTTLTGLSGTGVFIYPSGPLPRLRADNRRAAVCIVAPFPWGPANTIWKVTSGSDLLARHMPVPDATVFPCLAGLPWRDLYVVRALGGSSAAATLTFDDALSADSLTVTAAYHGALGNLVKIDITANVDVGTSRDVRVRVYSDSGHTSTVHDVTYTAVQVSNGTVTDPGDPYVTMAKASGATAPAAAAASFLASGSDGTLTGSLYGDALATAGGTAHGIGIVCFAGVATALCGDVNDELKAFLADEAGEDKIGIGPTPGAQSAASTITEVGAYDQQRMVRMWPRVQRYTSYHYQGVSSASTYTVCGGAAMACFIQNCDPWEAPMMSVVSDKRLNGSIIGLETAYETTGLSTYGSLEDAGVAPWFHHQDFGVVPKASNTTLIDAGVVEPIEERRYIMLLESTIAAYDERYLGRPLDVDLANNRLGTVTGQNVAAITTFLASEERAGRLIAGLNDDGSDSPAYDVDAFSLATSENLAAGRWDKAVSCRITPTAKQIVIHSRVARSVNIVRQVA